MKLKFFFHQNSPWYAPADFIRHNVFWFSHFSFINLPLLRYAELWEHTFLSGESSNNSVTVLWWSRAQSENGRTEKNSIKTETFSIFILSINWPLRTRSTGEFIYNNCKFIFEMRFCSARLTLQSASVSNFTVWRTSNSSKVLIEIKLEFFFCNWMGLKFELHQWKKSC